MQRTQFLAALNVVITWIVSARAEAATKIVYPKPPTFVELVYSNRDAPTPTTTATLPEFSVTCSEPPGLGNFVNALVPSSSLSSHSLSPALASDASDEIPDPRSPHISPPVAMVAGSLSGFIAILAAILVIFLVRQRKIEKRRRRRVSVIRALEAQHPGRFCESGVTDVDDDGFHSDSGSLSDDFPSARRPSSGRRTTHRGSRGKAKKKKGSSRHTSRSATRSQTRRDDIELEWRDSNSEPSTPVGDDRGTLPQTSTQTSPPTAPTASAILGDNKADLRFLETYPPNTRQLSEPQPHSAADSAFSEPLHVVHPTTVRPPPTNSLQEDPPPAYENVR